MTKKERKEESVIAPELQVLLQHNEKSSSQKLLSAEFKPKTRKIGNGMAMFGISKEQYEMEKFGFKKLGNVQDAMT